MCRSASCAHQLDKPALGMPGHPGTAFNKGLIIQVELFYLVDGKRALCSVLSWPCVPYTCGTLYSKRQCLDNCTQSHATCMRFNAYQGSKYTHLPALHLSERMISIVSSCSIESPSYR